MNYIFLMIITGLVVWLLLPEDDNRPWWKDEDWDDGEDDE